MDTSKLPRLSKTDRPPNDAPAPANDATSEPRRDAFCQQCGVPLRPGARFCDGCGAPVSVAANVQDLGGVAAEAWISIAVGVILLFLYPHMAQWISHRLFHTSASFLPITDVTTGEEIPYSKSIFFLNDLSIFAFAIVLILQGLVLVFSRKPMLVLLAMILTGAATLLNLYYLVSSFSQGFAVMSALAVAFGIYILLHQWRLFRSAPAK